MFRSMKTILALALGATSACLPSATAPYQEHREVAWLTESAEAYWSAMRWSQFTEAAIVIEDMDKRVEFLEHTQSQSTFKVSDSSILDVEVTDTLPPEDLPRLREGKVLVQVNGYQIPDMVLKTDITVQQWYRTQKGWFLDWEP